MNSLSYNSVVDSLIPIQPSYSVGLHDLIPDNLLGIFDENELEVYR